MFDFSRAHHPVPDDIAPLFASTFENVARPGNGWAASERVAIARAARSTQTSEDEGLLPESAVEASERIATADVPADEAWVRNMVRTMGECRFVELVGVTATIMCIDTTTKLVGADIEPLPSPEPGPTLPVGPDPKLKRRSAWVAMNGPPTPGHALSAAPRTQADVARLLDRLYITKDDVRSAGLVRGLTREQMEVVSLRVSLTNKCFY